MIYDIIVTAIFNTNVGEAEVHSYNTIEVACKKIAINLNCLPFSIRNLSHRQPKNWCRKLYIND